MKKKRPILKQLASDIARARARTRHQTSTRRPGGGGQHGLPWERRMRKFLDVVIGILRDSGWDAGRQKSHQGEWHLDTDAPAEVVGAAWQRAEGLSTGNN